MPDAQQDKPKHSPLPLLHVGMITRDLGYTASILSPDSTLIAIVHGETPEATCARAERVAVAVNAHAALVALRDAVDKIITDWPQLTGVWRLTLQDLIAAAHEAEKAQ